MKKSIWILLGLITGMLIYLFFFYHPSNRSVVIVEVPPGTSMTVIAKNLKEQNILLYPITLKVAAKISNTDQKMRSGFYKMHQPSSPVEIIKALTKGKMVLQNVVIPEGHSLKEIASALEAVGLSSQEDFLKVCQDSNWIESLGIDADTAEGYLYPETYFFAQGTRPETIVKTMVDEFFRSITDQDKQRADFLGFSIHQWVTLASIIEKEAGHPGEYEIISSVFHNRLNKNMRLQSDPTVIYGIKDYDGNIRTKDLRTPTPYNTYTIKGLPPGPIASPGKGALQAALYPADTEYYFFVSNNLKEHIFSKTYQEHKKHVQTYQVQGKNRK